MKKSSANFLKVLPVGCLIQHPSKNGNCTIYTPSIEGVLPDGREVTILLSKSIRTSDKAAMKIASKFYKKFKGKQIRIKIE